MLRKRSNTKNLLSQAARLALKYYLYIFQYYILQSLYSAIKKKEKEITSEDKAQLTCWSQKVINVLLLFLANWGPREDFVVGEAAWGREAPEGETGGETRPDGCLDNTVWRGRNAGLLTLVLLPYNKKILLRTLGCKILFEKKSSFLFGDNW